MTSRQRAALLFIHDRIAETGVTPTTDEIAAKLGISQPNTCEHLRVLMAEGFLRRANGRRGVRSLEVLKLPGNDLRAAEIAWCHAHADRVRALIAVVGDGPAHPHPVAPAPPLPGPTVDEAIDAGRQAIASLQPGQSAQLELPRDLQQRLLAYRRISVIAIRAWGSGGARRRSTYRGMQLHRVAAA